MSTPLGGIKSATNFDPWTLSKPAASLLSASAMSLGTSRQLSLGCRGPATKEPLACAWPLSMVRELSED